MNGYEVEREVARYLEEKRKERQPRLTQQAAGLLVWPDVGDQAKRYWQFRMAPSENQKPIGFKLGEFLDACNALGLHPGDTIAAARDRLSQKKNASPATTKTEKPTKRKAS